jgi:dTMP kinase
MTTTTAAKTTGHGVLVAIDGPSGVGKSTTAAAVSRRLSDAGVPTVLTAEPSDSDIGRLARNHVHIGTSGLALACLYAADRYHQLNSEIRPHVASGYTVIVDRYVASGLVMQRLDGVNAAFLHAINAQVDHPDLAVILTAQPDTVAARLQQRGAHNRYQRRDGSSRRELDLFTEAAQQLRKVGVHVLALDTTHAPVERVAAAIHDRIVRLREPQRELVVEP